jgi:MFS family permease
VAAAAFVPLGIIGPFGGALADRVPRRTLLIATSSVQIVLASVLTALAAAGTPSPAVVTGIVFLAGCAQALGFPAYQAILPDLVPEEDLVGAVALSSAQWNLGRIVGPALAGVVIAAGGYAWAFGINAASFLAVVGVLAALRLPAPAPHDGSSIVRSIAGGLGYVRRDRVIRTVVGYMALNSLLAAPFIALIPAMAQQVLDRGAAGTSVLVTAQGVGAVAMALSMGPLAKRFGPPRVLLLVLYALPVALVPYALAPNLGLSAVTVLVVGFFYLGALSSFTSIAQLRAPAAVRGRVMSVLMMLLGLLYPLGSVVQGELADVAGLRVVTAGAAILMFAILVMVRVLRPRLLATLEGSDADAPATLRSAVSSEMGSSQMGEPPW